MEEDNETTDMVESDGDQVEIAEEEHCVRHTEAYQQAGEHVLVGPAREYEMKYDNMISSYHLWQMTVRLTTLARTPRPPVTILASPPM